MCKNVSGRILRPLRNDGPNSVEAKLQAVAKAAQYEFPTADIDDMLREIDEGLAYLTTLPLPPSVGCEGLQAGHYPPAH